MLNSSMNVELIKPQKLNIGDTIATISPCLGIAGDSEYVWKYKLGKHCLEELGLKVVQAPNSMRGETFLHNNPMARAEDIMWSFENKDVKAIITNIGGNDSVRVLPHLQSSIIKNNPKIFIGYSDVMNIHLYCFKSGLSTFYGPNLLTVFAETPEIHPYSKYWFQKVLFNNSVIGEIKAAKTYSCDKNNFNNRTNTKNYYEETGYIFIQGSGKAQGQLFGGHTGLRDYVGIQNSDFFGKILFIEDIAEFFTPNHLADFIDWLGKIGALQKLSGIIIGRLCEYKSFDEHRAALLKIVNNKYGLVDLPIVANVNFGHASPTCILPYGATSEIDCDNKKISILESGVI